MGLGKRKRRNQKTEVVIGRETEKNPSELKWIDDFFAAFRYTGGPIRSKISPAASSSSSFPPPIKSSSPLNSFATSASAASVRNPNITLPPPPSRVNPKLTTSLARHKNNNNNNNKKNRKQNYSATTKVKKETNKPRTTLTASQKRFESYRRIHGPSNWIPPDSTINLLQKSHYYDPWRVLIICILLNRTKGVQVERMLESFFNLCPNAEAAKDVCDEKLMELLKPLGFYQLRTKSIKRFSREYLESEWTHVTQLHGVGKYAADAYAIFCVGEPEKVRPVDHKLVPYWKFLCDMVVQRGNQQYKSEQSEEGSVKGTLPLK